MMVCVTLTRAPLGGLQRVPWSLMTANPQLLSRACLCGTSVFLPFYLPSLYLSVLRLYPLESCFVSSSQKAPYFNWNV